MGGGTAISLRQFLQPRSAMHHPQCPHPHGDDRCRSGDGHCRSRDEHCRSRDDLRRSRDEHCRSRDVHCRSRDEHCRSGDEYCRSGDGHCRREDGRSIPSLPEKDTIALWGKGKRPCCLRIGADKRGVARTRVHPYGLRGDHSDKWRSHRSRGWEQSEEIP